LRHGCNLFKPLRNGVAEVGLIQHDQRASTTLLNQYEVTLKASHIEIAVQPADDYR
jgi:hypothetical protein